MPITKKDFLGFLPVFPVALAFIVLLFLSKKYPTFAAIFFLVVSTGGVVVSAAIHLKVGLTTLLNFLLIISAIIFGTLYLFSVIYSAETSSKVNYMEVNGAPKNLTISEAFYFSVITMTTLGYGDIVPYGNFRWIVITEVLLGVIYLGVFITGINQFYKK